MWNFFPLTFHLHSSSETSTEIARKEISHHAETSQKTLLNQKKKIETNWTLDIYPDLNLHKIIWYFLIQGVFLE